ncbi:MAG: DUF86 domain-containing protein [Nitrospiraceae bacterium]
MDRELVEAKLESLRRCIERITTKAPASAESLARDPDLQDIIALNLQRAVQLCVDLAAHVIADTQARVPSTMADNFDILRDLKIISSTLADRMTKAVGFRNIAVHSYQDIDWAIVFQICRNNLNDFQQFAQAVTARLESR